MPPDRTPLIFAVARDDDAARISAVLDALGYAPQRVVSHHARPAIDVALERLTEQYSLTEREAAAAKAIAHGATNRKRVAAAFDNDHRTAKWSSIALFARTGVDDFAGLCALLLTLCDVQAPTLLPLVVKMFEDLDDITDDRACPAEVANEIADATYALRAEVRAQAER